jgi:CubicO group peptidase (beta-lactamase class C family)
MVRSRITIKHMIGMRSGLYDYTMDPRRDTEFGDWNDHNGGILGFSTVAMYDPENGTDIVAAANLASDFSTPTL